MEMAVFTVLAFLQAMVVLAADGCSYTTTTRWTAYGPEASPQTLRCNSPALNQWWQRDSRQGTAAGDCELVADEWQRVEDCRNSVTCDRGMDASTVALEYCCTAGDNPAATTNRKCFTLSVCPIITSVTVPQQLFSGSQASLYLTLVAHPPSSAFTHPAITHVRDPSLSASTLSTDITTHAEFTNVTVAYSFTVPSDGQVRLKLHQLSASDPNCQSAVNLSLGYDAEHLIQIIQGDNPPPTQQSPSPQPPTIQTVCPTSTNQDVVPTSSKTITSSPSPPPTSTPPPTPSLSTPSPLPSPNSLPLATCTTSTDDGNPEGSCGVWMAVLGLIIILLLLALTVVMVMCVKLQCKRTFSPSRKTSLTDTSESAVTPEEDNNKKLSLGSSYSPPTSPPPPPPPPPPLHPQQLHIASSFEGAHGNGTVVTGPSPSTLPSSVGSSIYSKLFVDDIELYHHSDGTTVHLSPTHTAPHHNNSTPSHYHFFRGRMFREEDTVIHLDPEGNIGSPRDI